MPKFKPCAAHVPVSVIVPCFNNRELLPVCVDSIQKGTPPAQIIIVDDCSSDDSLAVAHMLATKFDNVEVIARAANGGAAAARRTGLDRARHSWVALVDADDFIEVDAVARAFKIARSQGSDICIWDMWRFDAGNIWPSMRLQAEDFPKSGRQAVVETLGNWRIHPLGVARTSLYSTAYAGFQETVINADELLTRVLFANARQVSFCEKRYFYRVNPRSTTRVVTERSLSALDSYLWLLQFVRDFPEVRPEVIGRDAIVHAWLLLRSCRTCGVPIGPKLAEFLPRFRHASGLRRWIWRYPKHLAAYAIMLTIGKFYGTAFRRRRA